MVCQLNLFRKQNQNGYSKLGFSSENAWLHTVIVKDRDPYTYTQVQSVMNLNSIPQSKTMLFRILDVIESSRLVILTNRLSPATFMFMRSLSFK